MTSLCMRMSLTLTLLLTSLLAWWSQTVPSLVTPPGSNQGFLYAQIFSVNLKSAITQTGSRGPESRCECGGHYPWLQCAGDHHPPGDPLSLHPDVRWVLIKITFLCSIIPDQSWEEPWVCGWVWASCSWSRWQLRPRTSSGDSADTSK